jgi:hypothetical protein
VQSDLDIADFMEVVPNCWILLVRNWSRVSAGGSGRFLDGEIGGA